MMLKVLKKYSYLLKNYNNKISNKKKTNLNINNSSDINNKNNL